MDEGGERTDRHEDTEDSVVIGEEERRVSDHKDAAAKHETTDNDRLEPVNQVLRMQDVVGSGRRRLVELSDV